MQQLSGDQRVHTVYTTDGSPKSLHQGHLPCPTICHLACNYFFCLSLALNFPPQADPAHLHALVSLLLAHQSPNNFQAGLDAQADAGVT